jgi:hypothetical protein
LISIVIINLIGMFVYRALLKLLGRNSVRSCLVHSRLDWISVCIFIISVTLVAIILFLKSLIFIILLVIKNVLMRPRHWREGKIRRN